MFFSHTLRVLPFAEHGDACQFLTSNDAHGQYLALPWPCARGGVGSINSRLGVDWCASAVQINDGVRDQPPLTRQHPSRGSLAHVPAPVHSCLKSPWWFGLDPCAHPNNSRCTETPETARPSILAPRLPTCSSSDLLLALGLRLGLTIPALFPCLQVYRNRFHSANPACTSSAFAAHHG